LSMATDLEKILRENFKDIVSALTFSIKGLGGSYGKRPVEEIYGIAEIFVRAQMENIVKGNFQPLVDFADMIAKKRSSEKFRLHELFRAGMFYKNVVYPLLAQHPWANQEELMSAVQTVDRSVDRFAANLAQIFVHYARESLAKNPLEFPVWMEMPKKRKPE